MGGKTIWFSDNGEQIAFHADAMRYYEISSGRLLRVEPGHTRPMFEPTPKSRTPYLEGESTTHRQLAIVSKVGRMVAHGKQITFSDDAKQFGTVNDDGVRYYDSVMGDQLRHEPDAAEPSWTSQAIQHKSRGGTSKVKPARSETNEIAAGNAARPPAIEWPIKAPSKDGKLTADLTFNDVFIRDAATGEKKSTFAWKRWDAASRSRTTDEAFWWRPTKGLDTTRRPVESCCGSLPPSRPPDLTRRPSPRFAMYRDPAARWLHRKTAA